MTNIVHRRNFLLSVASFTLVGTVLSCISVKPGYIADDKAATAKAIELFHVRLSKGDIDEIYSDADESFRLSQARQVLIAAIQATRARFGGFKTMTSSELNVIVGAPIQIRAAYNSTFEKGDATELFVFLKHGNKVQLSRYEIYPRKPGSQ